MATSFKSPAMRKLILVVLLSLTIPIAQADTDVDVCIIGAGPSGIQSAYSLEKKGYSVAVFEKNDYVGGKTKLVTLEGNDDPYELGAVVHVENEPSNLNALAKEFGVEGQYALTDYPSRYFDNATRTPLGADFARTFVELLSYFWKRFRLRKYLDYGGSFLSDYPEELKNLSFNEWLQQNGLSNFADNFVWSLMPTYGYGHHKDSPALYGLRYITSEKILAYGIGQINAVRGCSVRVFPFQTLLEKMAESLKGQVYLQANITNVVYQENQTVIEYTLGNAAPSLNPPAKMTCGSTIIAFAQTAENMKMFIPPDSDELSQLFLQVKTNSYYTMLFEDSDGAFSKERVVRYHVPLPALPDNPARNLLIWKPQDDPASSVISYYATPTRKPDDQARAEAVAHYSALVGRNVTIQAFIPWPDYFPHVDSESLNSGFYEKLDSYQGYHGQYYTGGLFNYEMVQFAMEHARYLIDTEF